MRRPGSCRNRGRAGPAREAAEPTLAIDIGGTKMQIGLVADGVLAA